EGVMYPKPRQHAVGSGRVVAVLVRKARHHDEGDLARRRRSAASSAEMVTTRKPPAGGRAETTRSEPAAATTPTAISSGGLLRKATPRPTARRIGKTNTQKTTSGSRISSRIRARTRRRNGCRLLIAQASSGERHEDVLEAGVARREA